MSLVFVLILFASVCSCNDYQSKNHNNTTTESTDSGTVYLSHSLEILNAEDFPILNELKESYKYGEKVTIILETITEHYYAFYVNGVKQEPDESVSDDWTLTCYTFTMPDEDVLIVIEDNWVEIPHSGYEAGFKMLRYNWDGYGIVTKEIYTCDLGYSIIDCLSELQETGEIIPKISDDVINDFVCDLPIRRGTVWIDCGSVGLFRLNPKMTEICAVESHLGEGKVLEMTDTLKGLLRQAWYYHPYDCWNGSYENGTVTLEQVYKKYSAVEWIAIENIHIENVHHSENNQITLRILASETKTANICLKSYQSNDNLGSFDSKEIELVSGEEMTVDFTFYGFYNYTYWVSITIDNTKIDLSINPKD